MKRYCTTFSYARIIFIVLCLISSPCFATPDNNNSKSTATELNIGETGNFSINASDDSKDWIKCYFPNSGQLRTRVRPLSGCDGTHLLWLIRDNSGDPGTTLDFAFAGSQEYSDWIDIGVGWYYLEVDYSDGQAENDYYQATFYYQPPPDTTPPTPNPSQWFQEPFPISPISLQMSGQVSTDSQSPPVKYYFDFVEGSGGHDSGWIDQNVYTDTELTPNTRYGYEAKARDSSSNQNETTPANKRSCYTYAAVPPTPIVANPTQTSLNVTPVWGDNPLLTELAIYDATRDLWVQADGSGTTQEYWNDYHWGTVTVTDLDPGTTYEFRLKAKNHDDIATSLGPIGSGTTSSAPNIELSLYRISDTSGEPNTSNPGTAKTNFYHGETIRVTLRANNIGSDADVLAVLNIREPDGSTLIYDSHDPATTDSGTVEDNSNDSPLTSTDGYDYYSFDKMIPVDATYGLHDIGASIRNQAWTEVWDTTAPGRNDEDWNNAWLEDQFSTIQIPSPEEWAMYAKDAQNSSQSGSTFPDNVTERWAPIATGTGGTASGASCPVVYDGKILVNSLNGVLYCIDATTAAVLWTHNPNQGITYPPHSSTPAVSSRVVVVGSASDREAVVAIDIGTGQELWNFDANVYSTGPDPVWASPTVVDDMVLIQNRGYIWALDLFGNGDGTTSAVWGGAVDLDRCGRRVLTDDFYDLVPVVIGDKLYAVTYCKDADRTDTSVVCLDVNTGNEVWYDALLNKAPYGSPVVFPFGNEVLISIDETLYAYDPIGNKRTVANEAWGTPAIFGNRIFCLKSTNFHLDVDVVAIDGSGNLLWQYDRRWAQAKEDPICDEVGNVIFGCTDGFLVCIDGAGTGTDDDILWEKTLEGDPVGKAASGKGSNDIVVARSWEGKVYCLVADVPNPPPTVQIVAPNSGGYFQAIVAVSATATDDVGVSHVQFEYSINGIEWYILPVGLQDDPANDARDWNGADGWGFDFDTITPDSAVGFVGNLNAAQVWVRGRAVDTSGNPSTWDECDQPFMVDNEGPDLSGTWARTNPAVPGTYEMLQSITDNLSGVRDDAIYPRFYYRWNNSTIDATNNDGIAVGAWDGSYYCAAITIGPEHVDDTIYWRVRAHDNVDNENWSDTHDGGVIQPIGTVATPTFSPDGDTYTSPVDVTISCSTSGATIHYTDDGSTPTESDPVYTSPINISTTTTLKAKAWKSGWNPSGVGSETYTITGTVATPTFSPDGGIYTSPVPVTISCAIAGATIHYTTNGNTPTETDPVYTASITISSTTMLKAKAFKTDWLPSGVKSAEYTITGTVATPAFDPGGGTYTSPVDVTISCSTSGATIHYTTDGSIPTESDPDYTVPIHISSTTTLKAKAWKPDWNPSEVAADTYVIRLPMDIYVDDDAPDDPGPGDPSVSDPLEDGTVDHPFDEIQEAIDVAIDGDTVIVAEGTYYENLNLDETDIILTSTAPSNQNVKVSTIVNGGGNDSVINLINANVTIAGFTITNGSSFAGGGIYCENSNPTISNCIFSGNITDIAGGGMYMSGEEDNAILTNCIFKGNSAEYGGAIVMDSEIGNNNATLVNCLFFDNSAVFFGGVMDVWNLLGSMDIELINCTLAGNSAPNGNALSFDSDLQAYPSNLQVSNCILWNGNDEIWNGDGSTITINYSDIQSGWGGPGENNINVDPSFVDADNDNFHLLAGSQCIDAGNNNALPPDTADLDGDGDTSELIPWDLDGNPRIIGDEVDMGAYEFQGLIIGDFCGANFDPPDGYVDVWDLMQFADHWHTRTGEGNWDSKYDLTGSGFGDLDGYVDVWDLMVFADHWHEGQKP